MKASIVFIFLLLTPYAANSALLSTIEEAYQKCDVWDESAYRDHTNFQHQCISNHPDYPNEIYFTCTYTNAAGTLTFRCLPLGEARFHYFSGCPAGSNFNDATGLCVSESDPKVAKNQGPQNICNGTNPINGGTGNKYQVETDYRSNGLFPLVFQRHYNSTATYNGVLGNKWRHSYSGRLNLKTDNLIVERPSGQGYQFHRQGNQWLPDADVNVRIEAQTDGGWLLTREDKGIEHYNSQGKLLSIRQPDGLTQSLSYDGQDRLTRVTDSFGSSLIFQYASAAADAPLTMLILPDQTAIQYRLTATGQLEKVVYPDATPLDDMDNPQKHYHYENTQFPSALTGITDENGHRYATWQYDNQGRGILSEHAMAVLARC